MYEPGHYNPNGNNVNINTDPKEPNIFIPEIIEERRKGADGSYSVTHKFACGKLLGKVRIISLKNYSNYNKYDLILIISVLCLKFFRVVSLDATWELLCPIVQSMP